MEYRIRQLLRSKVVPAMLSIALGIVIIIARRAALDLLVKIVGGLVIAAAVGFVVVYLTRKDKDAGNLTMVSALSAVTALTGILLVACAGNIVDIFPTVIGIVLVFNGLSHLTFAFVNRTNRFAVGAMGILAVLMGLMIVFRPGFLVNMIMVFIGASLIVNGLMDIAIVRCHTGAEAV